MKVWYNFLNHALLSTLLYYDLADFQKHQVLVKTWALDLYQPIKIGCECFNLLKNNPSYETIGEVILKINIVYAKKIKAEVYVHLDNLYPICKLN